MIHLIMVPVTVLLIHLMIVHHTIFQDNVTPSLFPMCPIDQSMTNLDISIIIFALKN